jgi:hypothetical protein
LRVVSIVLKDGGENFQFLCEGIFVTESFGSVYQGSEEGLFVSRGIYPKEIIHSKHGESLKSRILGYCQFSCKMAVGYK